MLRTRNDQPTLWESILPQDLLRLPVELARVDALLDDERFFTPFRAYFDLTVGRPSIPIEVYLRLMFLKRRYGLATSRCAPRWPTRSAGGGSPASVSTARAAPDHPDEDHHPVRERGDRGAQRGAARQGRRGEAAAGGKSPRRHHRGVGQR
jgi:hypothetical protein